MERRLRGIDIVGLFFASLCMFEAVVAMPCLITDGKAAPTVSISGRPSRLSRRAMTLLTASVVAGAGVSSVRRFVASSPVERSTAAVLIPVPPMSIPIAT